MKSKLPKVMHKVLDKPMLNWVIDTSSDFSNEIAVVLGYGIEKVSTIVSKNVKIYEQKEMLGTGHAVMMAKEFINDGELLILYGDCPLITKGTLENLLVKHRTEQNDATILTIDLSDPTGYGRIVRKNGKFSKIVEHKDATEEEKKINEINSGIAVYNGEKLKKALDKINNNNSQKEYYLPDVFLHFNKVGIYKTKDIYEVSGVNNRYQLSILEQEARKRLLKNYMFEGVTIIDPNTTYISANAKIGKDTIIYPQTYILGNTVIGEDCSIGPMTRLINCQIENNVSVLRSECEDTKMKKNVSVGPFARMRKGTILNENVKIGDFVETKNTVIEKNAKAQHLSYLGDATIGENVNIGAGTITCNYDGKNKNKTKIKNNAFIGSNSSLVAPVEIGENVLVAAGSVITKNVPDDSLVFGRAKQKIKEGWTKK